MDLAIWCLLALPWNYITAACSLHLLRITISSLVYIGKIVLDFPQSRTHFPCFFRLNPKCQILFCVPRHIRFTCLIAPFPLIVTSQGLVA